MRTVRLKDNIVVEIIPEYALPVEKWYGSAFAEQCMEAPDEVEQNWVYDPETGTFSESVDLEQDPAPAAEQETTVWDELDAAYQEGVNSAYDS